MRATRRADSRGELHGNPRRRTLSALQSPAGVGIVTIPDTFI
jgi:hypothetical protein